ncbi:MAG TPA: mandelate racemase/muconate lactonizing enzyme family protein, partial [Blastocatellia bacterium]
MKITAIQAFAVKIPRDLTDATGSAGSPAHLIESRNEYRWATNYPTLYSTKIETALIKVTTDSGLIGWGEAQSPVAPEVVCAIVKRILAPILIGEDPLAHEYLWARMYSAMRVRGHTGSFMLDSIGGIDTALWDIKGKALGARVCDLLGGPFANELPAYISGLSGADQAARVAEAAEYQKRGFTAFKVFMDGEPDDALSLHDALRERLGPKARLMVDALWRFEQAEAARFGCELDARKATWFEAPLKPEDVSGHGRLAASVETAIAIGECWRTRCEMRPFFDAGAVEVFQPDIGRTGVTEGMKLCALAELHNTPVAFHVSIGLGAQIAAALHVAASIPNLMFVECNPKVWRVAERLLTASLSVGAGVVGVPIGPGLGVEIDEEKL